MQTELDSIAAATLHVPVDVPASCQSIDGKHVKVHPVIPGAENPPPPPAPTPKVPIPDGEA